MATKNTAKKTSGNGRSTAAKAPSKSVKKAAAKPVKKAPRKSAAKAPQRTAPKQTALKEQSVFSQFRREMWGVACGILALMIIISSLDKSGFLARFFMGMVGKVGLYVLPIGLAFCAVALLFHGNRPVTMRVVSSLGFAFLISALAHLAIDSDGYRWGGGLISALYEGGRTGRSGGVIGGLLAMLFRLPGNKPVAWAICILLLIVAVPASVNLTLTGLLRAINNHRDELRRQEREENYREPAEVLVERVVQHRQEREVRRRERRRFDYDLPVDDPPGREPQPAKSAGKPARPQNEAVSEPRPEPPVRPEPQYRPEPQTQKRTGKPELADLLKEVPQNRPAVVDLLVDDPPLRPKPGDRPESPAGPAAEPPAKTPQKLAAEAVEPGQTIPMTELAPLPSDKVKASEARQAAAEIGQQIQQAAEPAKPAYVYPPTDLLDEVSNESVDAGAEMRDNTRRLQEKLACFNVDAQIVNVTRGPNVTMYELQLAQGVRLNKLTGLADDIALELGASGVRISAIPDKNSMVGIEVPNKQVSTVRIREILESREFQNARSKISFAVGKDINGTCVVGDIAKMPHVLIAGTTGSGKSVCTNSILVSLLYKANPDEVKLIVIDPKMVEFGIYNGVPHLLIPVVTDAKKAAGALQWAVTEMMRRYRTLSEAGVRDIESYNKCAATDEALEPMPKLVVVIDELADLMMVAGKEVEEAICRIAQMGRASGVHLVIATQRPSADVITGLMKANIPSRIALVVSSAMESRIILDATGAEKLIGKGDMLYAPLGKGKKRVQGCFIDETEVQRVIDFVKSNGSADYNDEVQQEIEQRAAQSGKGSSVASSSPANPSGAQPETEEGDELLPAAVDVFMETGLASVSMLQRRLKLGYARAARIVDEMEERGIVGPFEGSKPRTLLVTKEQWAAMKAGQSPDAAPPDGDPEAPVTIDLS